MPMAALMRVSDFDLLIVPTLGGAAADDWPSRWRAKLSTARLVAPADPSDRRREAWTDAICRAARAAARPVLFIGHGFSAAAIAETARELNGPGVRGAFLVAPPDAAGLERLAGSEWAYARRRLPWPSVVPSLRAKRSNPEERMAPPRSPGLLRRHNAAHAPHHEAPRNDDSSRTGRALAVRGRLCFLSFYRGWDAIGGARDRRNLDLCQMLSIARTVPH